MHTPLLIQRRSPSPRSHGILPPPPEPPLPVEDANRLPKGVTPPGTRRGVPLRELEALPGSRTFENVSEEALFHMQGFPPLLPLLTMPFATGLSDLSTLRNY